MIRIAQDGFRWELQDGFGPLLPGVLADAGQVIKESAAKLVTRHRAQGKSFFFKRYRSSAAPLRSLKFFFKRSQARQEWALAQQLERLGIATVRHVALGERWSWKGLEESVLITEGFDGKPLDESPDCDLRTVLEFVNRMHERGVLQRDLHPGNILVSPDGELRLVDLHGAEIRREVSPTERAENLALLRSAVAIPVSTEIQQRSVALRRQRLAYRSKRCLKHNREFEPKRFGGLKWWVRRPVFTENVQRILEDPDGFLNSRAEILKPGRTSTVGRAEGLVLKRFNFRKAQNLIKDLFRPSRAYRAYRKAYHLELLGIRTARSVAVSEARTLGFLRRSYFLMEEIPGALALGDYLSREKKLDSRIIRRAAELIAKLHAEGFSHRDLKESNLVVDRAGEVFVLDLDGLGFRGEISEARAAADLARLNRDARKHAKITAKERAVFLHRYCRARGLRRVPRAS